MGKIGIIIRREFNVRVRKKSFIITTLLMPILFFGMFAVVGVLAASNLSGEKRILVCDESGVIASGLESDKLVSFQQTDMSLQQIKEAHAAAESDEEIYGVLVIGADVMENPRNVQLYTYSASTFETEMEIASRIEGVIETEKLKGYDIENLPQIMEEVKTSVSLRAYRIDDTGEEKETASVVAMIFSYAFGFIIYMLIFLYGGMVMQGVIEEKSSKVIEVIVSSVKPFQLMMGKIIGIASVALVQFAIWIAFFFIITVAAGKFLMPDMAAMSEIASMPGMGGDMIPEQGFDPEMMEAIRAALDPALLMRMFFGFVFYFTGGYLLYAAMFAAVGSAVSTEADAQQLMLPITIPLIAAILIMMSVMRDPNSSLAVWTSIIPFTSPIVMLARLPYGVPMWELVTSVVVLFATFVFFVWFAGKIYRVGIFMYGKKPTFGELIKWSRYKY